MSGHWAQADVPTMWESAQEADTAIAWRQVTGWQTTYELLDQHQLQLRLCRDELQAAWPSERSPAAAAFVEYMDALLASMDQAKTDAIANRDALTHVLNGLSAAKRDVGELKAKWDGYADEEAMFRENQVELVQLSGGPNWREALNRVGRARMTQADQEVFEATQQMSIPIPFDLDTKHHSVPFPEPSSVNTEGGSLDGLGRLDPVGVGKPTQISDSSNAMPIGTGILGVKGSLQLAGLADSQAPSASSNVTAAFPGRASNSVSAGVLGQMAASMTPGRAPNSIAVGSSRTGAVRAIQAGEPFESVSMDGPASPIASRVNPVGGVIEATGERNAMTGPIGGGIARAGKPRRERSSEPWQTWTVADGVPSVLEPSEEVTHDPGPGVFGIDR